MKHIRKIMKYWGYSQSEQIETIRTKLADIEHKVFCRHRYEIIKLLEVALPLIHKGELWHEDNHYRALEEDKCAEDKIKRLLSRIDEETLQAIMRESFPGIHKESK